MRNWITIILIFGLSSVGYSQDAKIISKVRLTIKDSLSHILIGPEYNYLDSIDFFEITYLTLTKTNKIKAAVNAAGNSDLTKIDRLGMETHVYAELIPDYWKNKETELKKRSAVFFADKFPGNVPILLLHGNADWRVKSTNALEMALKFEEYRIPYRLKIFEGADHRISEFEKEKDEEVTAWFDRFLKNREPLPRMNFPKK
ncbi:MAG: alpha/beta hydrolase family protein [Saprospiraceae bacterium]